MAIAFMTNAQTTPTTQPSRWVLHADPASCTLERRNAEPAAALSIRTTPGSDSYRVNIIGGTVGKQASFVPATISFTPSPKVLKGYASVTTLPDGKQAVWMDGVAPELLDDISVADSVTIVTKPGALVSSPIAGSRKAIRALRECNANQLIEWGADAEQFAPGGVMPVALKRRDDWLTNKDLLAIVGQSGRSDVDTLFRVAISAEGIVDTCQPVDDRVGKGIEKIACAAVSGKRLFVPAKAANGRPVRGVATFRILLASRPTLG